MTHSYTTASSSLPTHKQAWGRSGNLLMEYGTSTLLSMKVGARGTPLLQRTSLWICPFTQIVRMMRCMLLAVRKRWMNCDSGYGVLRLPSTKPHWWIYTLDSFCPPLRSVLFFFLDFPEQWMGYQIPSVGDAKREHIGEKNRSVAKSIWIQILFWSIPFFTCY